MFKNIMIPYGVSFLTEELGSDFDEQGEVIRIHYGVERIPDRMLCVEFDAYRHGLNVDRIVAFCALISFVRIQFAAKGVTEIHEYAKNLENPLKNVKLIVTPFRNIGGAKNTIPLEYRVQRTAFRNYR